MVVKIEQDKIIKSAWWNRPLIGKKTLTEYLLSNHNKKLNIPFEQVYLHNKLFYQLEQISITLKALFNDSFAKQDFLIFGRIEGYFTEEKFRQKHYLYLGKNLFTTILDHLKELEQLTRLQAKCQNEVLIFFHRKSVDLISAEPQKLIFQAKLKKIYQYCRQEFTKYQQKEIRILKRYYRCLYLLSQVDNLLTYFTLLQKHGLDNWQILAKLKKFMSQNKYEEHTIEQLQPFILLTKIEQEYLLQLAEKVIQIKKSPDEQVMTIARILQYTALDYKYSSIYPQFTLFLEYLRKWEKRYYRLMKLRNQYSSEEYILPTSFKVKTHGFEFYKSYHDYLDAQYCKKQL